MILTKPPSWESIQILNDEKSGAQPALNPVRIVESALSLREVAFAGVAIVVAVGPIRTDRI